MEINLTPELEEIVKGKIESGLYSSADEVVRKAVSLLDDRDTERERRLEDVRSKVAAGREQIERGQFQRYESMEDLMDEIEADVAGPPEPHMETAAA
jgi:antitoxin ParD1/3/4